MSQLTKVRYDKRTTAMDQNEEKYWLHFLQGDRLVGDFIKSQMRHNPQMRRDILNQPVCKKCEKFCFYDKQDMVTCPTCGTSTPQGQTHKVKIHLAEGHFR